ncbi:hypothetical protein [Methanosphaerula subterraneus]|uniref:hypothetical protein n=1 Tax=Methanosphaerula subterraneus TaxID=3350244 RepID=UPI003F8465D6
MKDRIVLGIVALSAVFALFLIIHFASAPILYSPTLADSTGSHLNPGAMQELPLDKYEEILPMMQDILDLSGSVVHNMRYNNIDVADHDLKEYIDLSKSLDQFVVNLDLSDSELEAWRQENYENRVTLTRLVNDTKQLEDVKSLEAKYQNQNQSGDLTAIISEESTLNQKIKLNSQAYKGGASSSLTNLSKKFDLNTARFEKSAEDMTVISKTAGLSEISAPQNHGGVLTFYLSQTSAAYGEAINASGILKDLGDADQIIEVGVDRIPWSTVTPNPDRSYETSLMIRNISSGSHNAYVRNGAFFVKESEFQVISSDVTITFGEVGRDGTNIMVSGTLRTASGIPVAGAPIKIIWDKVGVIPVLTDLSGVYRASVALPPGNHQMKARFESPEFPLNQSESPEISVEAPNTAQSMGMQILTYLLLGGIVLLAYNGASRYLHRRRVRLPQIQEPQSGGLKTGISRDPTPPVTSPWDDTSQDVLIEEFRTQFTDEQSSAMHILYRNLKSLTARHYPRAFIRALTPRELMRLLERDGEREDLQTFIGEYEKVRYGGLRLPHERQGPIISWFQRILSWFGGDRH